MCLEVCTRGCFGVEIAGLNSCRCQGARRAASRRTRCAHAPARRAQAPARRGAHSCLPSPRPPQRERERDCVVTAPLTPCSKARGTRRCAERRRDARRRGAGSSFFFSSGGRGPRRGAEGPPQKKAAVQVEGEARARWQQRAPGRARNARKQKHRQKQRRAWGKRSGVVRARSLARSLARSHGGRGAHDWDWVSAAKGGPQEGGRRGGQQLPMGGHSVGGRRGKEGRAVGGSERRAPRRAARTHSPPPQTLPLQRGPSRAEGTKGSRRIQVQRWNEAQRQPRTAGLPLPPSPEISDDLRPIRSASDPSDHLRSDQVSRAAAPARCRALTGAGTRRCRSPPSR